MRPELIIFDMDGLIFDTERLFMKALSQVMAEKGYNLTEEVYLQTLGAAGSRVSEIMHRYYGDDYDDIGIGQAARERMEAETAKNGTGLPLKKGILELLVYLVEQDIPCVVASSTRSVFVKKYLEEAGIDWYFRGIVGGDMVKESKPNPEIFLKACSITGTMPEHALVLEDSENGIKAAAAGNIPVLCIPDMKYPEKEAAKLAAGILEDGFHVIEYLQGN